MIFLGIVIGLVVGIGLGMVSGYLYSIFETWAGYLMAKIESKKSPYVKDITDTNAYVAKMEDEINGKEEKVPAIGFDIGPYVVSEDDYEEEEPEGRNCGFIHK